MCGEDDMKCSWQHDLTTDDSSKCLSQAHVEHKHSLKLVKPLRIKL